MNQDLQFLLPKLGKMCSLALIVFLASALGALLGSKFGAQSTFTGIPPIPLKADTASKGKTMSMATGLISPEVEGLYVLDHASGLLQCWLLNPRTGAVGGIYQANVLADLGIDNVMVTGGFAFTGGVMGNVIPSGSIVYVADEATGKVVGYSFSFNRTELNRGVMQRGILRAVCTGPTRGASMERDQ
jgi:hypothetical protein